MSSQTCKPKTNSLHSCETPQINNSDFVDTRCGFWVCKPTLMQPMANMGLFTTAYGFTAFITQTLSLYVNSQITTLERQFGFNSYQTGIIMGANDIGYLVCVLFLGYVATMTHIPRSLGIATIIYGVSGLACAIPHFLFGQISHQPTTESINSSAAEFNQTPAVYGSFCNILNYTRSCAVKSGADPAAFVSPEKVVQISFFIIVIGMALQGFGKAPRFSFSVTYVDNNTAKVNTGFYMGIISATTLLGPACAFLVGGIFTRMYVTLEATQLTPRHPRWIGAWWLGFLLFGLLGVLVAIPMFCFPRRMPRQKGKDVPADDKKLERKSPQDNHRDTPPDQRSSFSRLLHVRSILKHSEEFLACMYRLTTNPIYVCLVIASCFTIFTVSGNSTYISKYMEIMFHLPAHTANYITAGQILCTSVVGALVGGILSKRLKMTAMTALKFSTIAAIFALITQFVCFLFRCEQPTVNNWPGEENSCNSGCNCRNNSYFPICGGDGRTYYSPCHAGCLQTEQGVYNNCTCIPGGQATGGTCDYSCSHLYGYPLVMGVRYLFHAISLMPKLVVLIRCVHETDKAMAISASQFMVSLLGWLLAPILFGNAIDSACVVWDIKCHTMGRCLLYDNHLFNIKFHGYGGLGMSFALVFLVVAYLYARWTKCLEFGDVNNPGKDTAELKVFIKCDGDVNNVATGKVSNFNSEKDTRL